SPSAERRSGECPARYRSPEPGMDRRAGGTLVGDPPAAAGFASRGACAPVARGEGASDRAEDEAAGVTASRPARRRTGGEPRVPPRRTRLIPNGAPAARPPSPRGPRG